MTTQSHSSESSLNPFIVGMVLGLIQGILFGILFAPKSGERINRSVNRFLATLPEQLKQEGSATGKRWTFFRRTHLQLEDRVAGIQRNWRANRLAEAQLREAQAYGYDTPS